MAEIQRRGLLWEATFTVGIVRKAVTRSGTAYVAGCLFRVVELCAQALHGHTGHWLINETVRLPQLVGGRPPAGFAERAQGLMAHLGSTPDELSGAIDSAVDLLADTTIACQPSAGRSSFERRVLAHGRRVINQPCRR